MTLPKLAQRYGTGMGVTITEDDLEQDETGDWVHKTPVKPEPFHADDALKNRVHRKVWRTKDKREIPIAEMETVHILRTLNILKTNAPKDHPVTIEYTRLFKAELHSRDPNAF